MVKRSFTVHWFDTSINYKYPTCVFVWIHLLLRWRPAGASDHVKVIWTQGAFHLFRSDRAVLLGAVEQIQTPAQCALHALKLKRLQRYSVLLNSHESIGVQSVLLFQFEDVLYRKRSWGYGTRKHRSTDLCGCLKKGGRKVLRFTFSNAKQHQLTL